MEKKETKRFYGKEMNTIKNMFIFLQKEISKT